MWLVIWDCFRSQEVLVQNRAETEIMHIVKMISKFTTFIPSAEGTFKKCQAIRNHSDDRYRTEGGQATAPKQQHPEI